MASSAPVTVTVWVLFQLEAVNVSVPEPTVPSSVSPLLTATVTSAVGSLLSATVKLEVPPASVACPVTGPVVSPVVSSSVVRAPTFTLDRPS